MNKQQKYKIKVLVVNERDVGGGAARTSVDISHAVRRFGIDAKMFVQNKNRIRIIQMLFPFRILLLKI